jgi:plasmid stabilization system protein ParE
VTQRITKRPRAKRDLIDHFAYLVEHASPEEAHRFLRAIDAALELLVGMPEMGARWHSSLPRLSGVRRWIPRGYKNYLLLYRPTRTGIELLHVYYSARDIPALLADEDETP